MHDPACRCNVAPQRVSRRELLATSANGFGLMALSALLADRTFAGPAALPKPHFAAKAKNVIFCFMDGGVSHVDSFDPKPKLTELHGKEFNDSQNPTAAGKRQWVGSPWKFNKHGESGLEISELFPHIATCADELAVIRSMRADFPLHARGNLLLHTGHSVAGRPSFGSWVTYGLGSENQNLPGFVVLKHNTIPPGGIENFSNGFLPASFQATQLKAEGVPIDNLAAADQSAELQRLKLDVARQQNEEFAAKLGQDSAVESAIANYELAYRMQSLMPEVLDTSRETAATQKMYGLDAADRDQRLYATQCLRARRLVEAGVRFVEVCTVTGINANGNWDQHGDLKRDHEKNALATDQAVAALIKDLRARGLLDETLVLWAGEFGRTPHGRTPDGRDHHPEGFSIFMAGGGIKPGTCYGATDELGMAAVENIVDFHDLHATILHLLGLDHERLTYRFGGRDFRLTDVHGRVIRPVVK